MQHETQAQAAEMPRSEALDILTLKGIEHRYGRHRAVAGIDLSVRQGEVVCLLGPSGCGKTTLLRVVAGLEVLQAGDIALQGRSLGTPHVPPEQRNVGLAFQEAALFPHLSVLENVTFGLKALPSRQRRERALALLAQLGMDGHAASYPHTLSGGQQQRVALARALAPQPGLMLLDEPFSSLDARLRDRIRDDTLHVLKQQGAGGLLVTHDPEEAMFMADRIALMRDGHIVQTGTPRQLYCHPVDPFVVTFFGAVNELSGEVREGRVATAVGEVAAPGLTEGERAQVLVRPEALSVEALDEPQADHHSHILMAKLLGRTSLLHICAHGLGRESHLHARVPGVFLPEPGQPVALRLDPSQVFVFPAGAGAPHGEA
ncbi:ABC transporter ATP-binding protein [Halomonas sp. 18H]|uniref:ABC transporter ATP-binding protein n=1 Tax=Halomonas almeriensis TaxID=308163 RepID=UPI00222E7DCB|nr:MULTISPECIES: ABC transporter ATP-binding protein [Halomonas]MCW4153806.1 ABC transporter ATP-binding protein [Halomonas sp. 18H]MDN3553157.1 ABC transporter ATP-binding protein [Halomonas almeriensis]